MRNSLHIRPMLLRSALCALCLLFLALSANAQSAPKLPPVEPVDSVGGVNLPGVPSSVTKAAVAAGNAARESRESADANNDASAALPQGDAPITLTVSTGVTELVRISRGYLNRVITPFEDPKVLTVNPVEVQKEGSSLYLTTTSERPVGIHILSNDPGDTRSISLTLIPARIPPKTVTLKWPEGEPYHARAVSNSQAKRWEESAPYEQTLFELARLIARGEVPAGYALAEKTEQLPCRLPKVEFFTGQRLTGTHFSVFVLRATNHSEATIEIRDHGGCGLPGVVLVAPWPRAHLQPGDSTELYVAVANDLFAPNAREQFRPSLLTQ